MQRISIAFIDTNMTHLNVGLNLEPSQTTCMQLSQIAGGLRNMECVKQFSYFNVIKNKMTK